MEYQELLRKIKKIELKAKGKSKQLFSGNYHSAFKGKGMTFAEVRDYQYGDEVRTIDWNVTARFNTPFVKTFEEEREQTLMLIIDVSASQSFGSISVSKRDFIAEIAAVIAFSAAQNNDKIGVIFVSDQIEKFIAPQKGRNHVMRIIRDILTFEAKNQKTDLSIGLSQLAHSIKKHCTSFVISDFINNNYSDALKTTSKKHQVIALKIFDELEINLPDLGLIKINDIESQETIWVNSSSKKVRETYQKNWIQHVETFKTTCKKAGVKTAELNTSLPYTKTLLKVFQQR